MKNGRKDICMVCSRGIGDQNVCNCPFDWKFNLLQYDIVLKHSIRFGPYQDFDGRCTHGEISNSSWATVPVECKVLVYHLQASIDITEEEQKQ